MNDEIFTGEDQTLPVQRSTFLTVLCVLTFLGSAYGIFSGLTSVMQADKLATEMQKNFTQEEKEKARKNFENTKGKEGTEFAMKVMNSMDKMTAKNFRQAGIGATIASVLTLVGALLMWRLNRTGFYVYVVGIIASVAIPFIIFGNDNIIGILGAIFPAFFGVIFIAMYAFNLKDMR